MRVSSNQHCFLLTLIFLLAYLIVFARPLNVEQWQWADEGLYLKNALSMVEYFGQPEWLGPLDAVILSKAPFYSVFLAISTSLGIPYRLAEFLVFCPLPFLFWMAVRPLGLPKWPVLYIAAAYLLFLPVVSAEFRLLRNSLFGAVSLYCLISIGGLLIRGWLGIGKPWKWGALAGLSMGIAATTREEAVWMMVPALLTVIILVLQAWRNHRLRQVWLPILALVAAYMIPPTFFSTLNYTSYGIYAPSLRQHRYFKELYSVLVSLEPENRRRYVPIITETRKNAYKISPRFAQLQPYLDGPAMDAIATNNGHMWLNGWPSDGSQREFFVSNFEFALAASIIMSGKTTGEEILHYSKKTARELDKLAKRGAIEQGQKGISLMPPIVVEDYLRIIQSAFQSMTLLLTGKDMTRTTQFPVNPDLAVSSEWHAMLGTWPGGGSDAEPKLMDYLYNNILVGFAKYLYAFCLLLGIFSLFILFRRNTERFIPYLLLVVVSWAAVFSFNGILGILDTIGWRTLMFPKSYNSIGYFPFHFAMLTITIVAVALFSGQAMAKTRTEKLGVNS